MYVCVEADSSYEATEWQDDKWNKAELYDVGHIAQQCGRERAGIAMECMSSEARGNTCISECDVILVYN